MAVLSEGDVEIEGLRFDLYQAKHRHEAAVKVHTETLSALLDTADALKAENAALKRLEQAAP